MTTKNYGLAVNFPATPFNTYDEFEEFIFANGYGFSPDDYEGFIDWAATEYESLTGIDIYELDEPYTPSATNGDYSPSCPWNAPGMSVSDFI